MKITPELLAKIAAAAEQVRKADMELTLANRNPSPSIYVQRNALRGAENKLQELLPVETVIALVAAVETLRQQLADEQETSGTLGRLCYELGEQVEAGAADSRRLDALRCADELYFRRHEEATASFHGESTMGKREQICVHDDGDGIDALAHAILAAREATP